MIKATKEKKIIYRLVALSLITTPLFALLGGTPFFRFDFKELKDFLPGILFTTVITLIFWLINITILLLAEKYPAIKNIFLRALISIALGLMIAAAGFHFYMSKNLPPRRLAAGNMMIGNIRIQATGLQQVRAFGDSNYRIPPPGNFIARQPRFIFFPMVLRLLTINLIILTLSELVFLHFRKQKIEDENIRLRQMNLEAKNNQLKMQLHPHFLFNSLNTLRLLLKKDADKAEDYLLKLSEMLRFSTTSALNNVVEIEDELKLCISYLQMQKVRFDNMLHFSVTNAALYDAKGKLPVYSLQLLVENAIKHNAFTNEDPLTIYIDYEAEKKLITVRNRIQQKRTMEPTTRTGLKNLDERYRLLNQEGIAVSNSDGEFIVSLSIL